MTAMATSARYGSVAYRCIGPAHECLGATSSINTTSLRRRYAWNDKEQTASGWRPAS